MDLGVDEDKLRNEIRGFDRINVGCGLSPAQGWLNIGLFSNNDAPPGEKFPYGTTKIKQGAMILHFDITKEIPIPKNNIQFVYAGHFIEHLPFKDGIDFLKKCHQYMKEGGIIRLAFPDLGLWIKKYYEDDSDFFKKYYSLLKWHTKQYPYLMPELKTKGEIFMLVAQMWGHKWLYDFESVKDVLERAGFVNISREKFRESSIPDIEKVEPADEERILESAYVEAEKPSNPP